MKRSLQCSHAELQGMHDILFCWTKEMMSLFGLQGSSSLPHKQFFDVFLEQSFVQSVVFSEHSSKFTPGPKLALQPNSFKEPILHHSLWENQRLVNWEICNSHPSPGYRHSLDTKHSLINTDTLWEPGKLPVNSKPGCAPSSWQPKQYMARQNTIYSRQAARDPFDFLQGPYLYGLLGQLVRQPDLLVQTLFAASCSVYSVSNSACVVLSFSTSLLQLRKYTLMHICYIGQMSGFNPDGLSFRSKVSAKALLLLLKVQVSVLTAKR